MPVAPLNLCFFLLVLNVESVVSVCDISVHTINFGCHLEWDCPDANPKTTYTVLSKTHGTSWENVSDCIQISRQSCDLSHVFPNINIYNFIRLTSELLWLNETRGCTPITDPAAKFTPPSITNSMANGSLWVTVNFPCAPSISCTFEDDDYVEGNEMGCYCPLTEFKSLWATVTLYNEQNLSDRQAYTAEVMLENPFEVEFGFLTPGQVYCAVANFTAEGVLTSSPPSLPQCVYIPAKLESLIVIIVCAVLIVLGLVFFLVWRKCSFSERPLPRSLALLRDLELQNETFIDSSKVAPHNKTYCSMYVAFV
ncbi:uncharacterized protein [Sinocyclocheilus grahami]|uniref:uncharacterized protein n=1 Tax=Sinocyclocheilus grahami TaxID=75366 RepID=UPI0007ACD044|nr:PREDICTED: uncharacterized protein LOC107588206 [Sinocyclocheilus grahami]